MRRALAITLLSLLPLCVATADIYRSVDAQGHVQYSDTPSPGAELVSSSDSRSTASSTTSTRIPSLAQQSEQISAQLTQQQAARVVQRDLSDVHSKQCKQAQENYQQSVQARRLYKMGPDGERQYLSDDEADQQRVNNRMTMQTACEGMSDSPGAGGSEPSDTTSGATQGGSSSPPAAP